MTEELNIRLEKREGSPVVMVIHLEGYLQANTLEKFKASMDSIFEQGIFNVVFNCENIKFASSAALGALMSILDEIENRDGQMVMAKLSPPIEEVFELLDFYDIFPVTQSIDEALSKF